MHHHIIDLFMILHRLEEWWLTPIWRFRSMESTANNCKRVSTKHSRITTSLPSRLPVLVAKHVRSINYPSTTQRLCGRQGMDLFQSSCWQRLNIDPSLPECHDRIGKTSHLISNVCSWHYTASETNDRHTSFILKLMDPLHTDCAHIKSTVHV